MNEPRILVVDDEPGMLRSVKRVLSKDYMVESAPSPREAITLAQQFKPDLAILDIQMPEMDGFQLMERLQGTDPELEVIFMTPTAVPHALLRFKKPSTICCCSSERVPVSVSLSPPLSTVMLAC